MSNGVIKINRLGDDGYRQISVRIKESTLSKLEELSGKSNRSRNQLINILLEKSVDNVEISDEELD